MVDRHPLINFVVTAHAVLIFALVGSEGDPVGKTPEESRSPANGSSPPSTVPAP
jgi:hypothetical protein